MRTAPAMNRGVFVGKLPCVPFVDRNDWQGWTAFAVLIAATMTMLAMWVRRTVQNLLDCWRDDLD